MSSCDYMTGGGCSVAVLVPCYNEEATVGKVVDDFRRELPKAKIYVYDNNSTDRTTEIALAHGAIVAREPRQGKGNVVRSMLRDIEADCYLLVDGDDTYPAEFACKMCAPILAGEADMVVGDRLSNGSYAGENKRAMHGFGNELVRKLIRHMYGCPFEDVMTGYHAFSRAFAKTFPVLSSGFQIETELSIHAADRAWRVVNVPIAYRDRPEGSVSKLNTVHDGIRVLWTIGSMFKDYRPLRFFSFASFGLLLLSLLFGVPVIFEFAATGLISKLPSAVLAVGFAVLSALALVTGFILDSIAKAERRRWELEVYRVMRERPLPRVEQGAKR